MLPSQILDYTILDLPPYLIEYFQGTDLSAYAAALDVQYDQIEQACFDLINQLWLDLAIGAQLDVLGVQLNLPRNGMDDVTYRTMLSLMAYINHSGGTPESAIAAIRITCNDPVPVYMPAYPAGFAVTTTSLLGIGTSFDLNDSLGNTIVDKDGNTIEIAIFAPFTPDQVAAIAPAGVAWMQLSFLLDNLSEQMVDNLGNSLCVLFLIAEP